MTDEEKAEELTKKKIKDMKVEFFNLLQIVHLSNGANLYNPKIEDIIKEVYVDAYLAGLAEGRKEKECNCMTYLSFKTLEKENAELAKRITELQADKEKLINDLERWKQYAAECRWDS